MEWWLIVALSAALVFVSFRFWRFIALTEDRMRGYRMMLQQARRALSEMGRE